MVARNEFIYHLKITEIPSTAVQLSKSTNFQMSKVFFALQRICYFQVKREIAVIIYLIIWYTSHKPVKAKLGDQWNCSPSLSTVATDFLLESCKVGSAK